MVDDAPELMQCMVRGDVSVGVPQGPGKRVLAPVLFSHVKNISPSGGLLMPDIHIVNWNHFRSDKEKIKIIIKKR